MSNYSMSNYIIDGIWEAKQCILLGMILWLLWNLILFSLKKRSGERLKKYGFKYLFCELLLVIYLCTILTITGIIRTDISTYVYSVPNMTSLLNIPFKGASIKMVILNYLLFAPYGFLIFILYGHKKKLSWKKAILIGFFTSLFIEIFQAFTGRLPEVDDLIANTSGACLGYVIWFITRKIAGKNCGEKYKMAERKWEPAIYVALAFLGTFFLYDPYAI